jgi:hypothetical protein
MPSQILVGVKLTRLKRYTFKGDWAKGNAKQTDSPWFGIEEQFQMKGIQLTTRISGDRRRSLSNLRLQLNSWYRIDAARMKRVTPQDPSYRQI